MTKQTLANRVQMWGRVNRTGTPQQPVFRDLSAEPLAEIKDRKPSDTTVVDEDVEANPRLGM